MFKIYKDDSVVVEGESPLSITGLAPNTDVEKGTYQAVRIEDERESERVDVPAFKTLPIAVTGVTIAPKTAAGESGTAGSEQLTSTVVPANATNNAVTYSVAPTTAGLTINASGKLSWTDAVAEGTYTVTVKTADGNKTDTSVLTLSAAPEPEPEPEE